MSGTIGPQGQQQLPQMPGAIQPQPFSGGQPSPQLMAMLAALSKQTGGMPGGMPMTGPTPGMQPPPGMTGPTPGMQPPQGQPMPQAPPPQAFSGPPPQPIPPPIGAPAPMQNLQMFGNAAQGQRGPANGMRMSPAEMQSMGRFGDTVLAHLTPGEITVPKEAQTPQVQSALHQAFGRLGVAPSMFMAGSPQSSTNPQTGAAEYSILGALLPVLGAIGGSFVPGIGTALGMGLGGALGGAAGGMMDKLGPAGTIASALGGGLGGAAGGMLGGAGDAAAGGASGAGGAAASSAPFGGMDASMLPGVSQAAAGAAGGALPAAASGALPSAAGGALGGAAPMMAPAAAATGAGGAMGGALPFGAPAAASGTGSVLSQIPWRGGMAAGLGSMIGQSMAPPPPSSNGLPPGFNTPMSPVNPGLQIGGHAAAQPPSFAGYNPYSAVTGSPYSFYR